MVLEIKVVMLKDVRKLLIIIVAVCLFGFMSLLKPLELFVRSIEMKSSHRQVAIPTGATAYCTTNLRTERLRFNRRMMVESYRKIGRHNPVWDAAALRYLEACSRSSSGIPNSSTPEVLARTGQALINLGCNDPMIEYNFGLNLLKSGLDYNYDINYTKLAKSTKIGESKRYIEYAIEGFKSFHYPRSCVRIAPLWLMRLDHELAKTSHDPHSRLAHEENAMKSQALQWLGESLQDGSYTSSDLRIFFHQIDNELDHDFTVNEVVEKLHAISGVDPFLLNMFEGREEYEEGCQARGKSHALLKQHLIIARKKLTKAWQQHPELPEAAGNLIGVAMELDDNSKAMACTWFNRAVTAQMDYVPAYTDLLLALRPCCGGSYEEMYRVGLASLATRRFDTYAPEGFVYAVRHISEDAGSLEYWHRPETYQLVQTLFAGYMKEPVPPREHTFYLSWYAACAFLCGHYADAQYMLDKLGSHAEKVPFLLYAHCSLATARSHIRLHQPPDLRQPIPTIQ
jgi:hypothetical protein